MNTVIVKVKDARYYADQNSILIVGEEVETRRPITQQMLISTICKASGLPLELVGDHDAWKFFASQLKGRRDPFKLIFEGSRKDTDEI